MAGPSRRGVRSVVLEEGQIIDVHAERFTVDVQTRQSQRTYKDVEVTAAYLHWATGEGIYVMPEVGALVQMCIPSSGRPFVLCFSTTFERDPDQEQASFRAGRPLMKPGDIVLRGRDGNHVWLHRGGVLEVGNSTLPKRFYIPLNALIRDVCLNSELITGAGELRWDVLEADRVGDGSPFSTALMRVMNRSGDQKGTVALQMGHVTDSLRMRLTVSPEGIEQDGSVSGEQLFFIEVADDGAVSVSTEGDFLLQVAQNLTATVSGDLSMTVEGSATWSVGGELDMSVTGSHTLSAARSTERIDGAKVFDVEVVTIGAARYPVLLATPALLSFLVGHNHGPSTGTPLPALDPISIVSRKLRSE